MRMRHVTMLAALSMAMSAGLLVGSSSQAAGPAMLPQLPAIEGASQVEPAHWRRYRHCHRTVVRKCWGWRNRHCRNVVRNYCHRR